MSSPWSRASHSTPLAEISLSPGLILPSDMAGSLTYKFHVQHIVTNANGPYRLLLMTIPLFAFEYY